MEEDKFSKKDEADQEDQDDRDDMSSESVSFARLSQKSGSDDVKSQIDDVKDDEKVDHPIEI